MATQMPPPRTPPGGTGKTPNGGATVETEVELLKVIVTREGQKVSAQWAIHPQIKQDLQSGEWKEVSELMAKVTSIVGSRFSEILAKADSDKPGTA